MIKFVSQMMFSFMASAQTQAPFHSYKLTQLRIPKQLVQPIQIRIASNYHERFHEFDLNGEMSLILLYRCATDWIAAQTILHPDHVRSLLRSKPDNKKIVPALRRLLIRLSKKDSAKVVRTTASKVLATWPERKFARLDYGDLAHKLAPVLKVLYEKLQPQRQPPQRVSPMIVLMKAKDYHLPPMNAARVTVSADLSDGAIVIEN